MIYLFDVVLANENLITKIETLSNRYPSGGGNNLVLNGLYNMSRRSFSPYYCVLKFERLKRFEHSKLLRRLSVINVRSILSVSRVKVQRFHSNPSREDK